MTLPLEGLFVLELGVRSGASLCGSLLAQLGAEVAFVEQHPRIGVPEHKLAHRACLAAGKRSLVPGAGDAPLLRRLVLAADVVLTSSDLDPPLPDLPADWREGRVLCDLTAYGASGPLAGRPDGERQVQARSGVMQITGLADGPPVAIDLPLVEFMTGAYAAAAVLAALRARRLGAGGQAIDMALYDCAFAAISTFLPRVLDGSNPAVKRVGNRHAMATPWNVYRAKDGWVQLCAASDVQWQRLTEVIGQPALAGDPRYAKLGDRVARNSELDAIVQRWVETQDVEACVAALNAAAIASGPITPVEDYPREANLDYRGMIRRLADPVSGSPLWLPASPLRMSATPGRAAERIPAPDADRAALAERAASLPSAAAGERRLPLAGLRVLEIGHYTTAPLSARHLANLGAEVIKIEPPGGEAVRDWPPARDGQGLFFTYTNADKRSLELDMKAPADAALLDRLIDTADVLIENLKPGALAKRGLTPAAIAKRNPRLIYCAVSGFGQDSIYDERPAFDTVIQAMSGLMDLIRAEGIPVKSGPSSADLMGAELAVVAVLAALEARDRTGEGQYVDLSMQDIAAWMTQTLWNGAKPVAPGRVLACSDGWVHVEGEGALPDLAARTRAEAVALAEARGLQAAPVETIAEVVAAPQTVARRLWFEVEDEQGRRWPLLESPLRLLGTPPGVKRLMPPLGSDRAHYEAALGVALNAAK